MSLAENCRVNALVHTRAVPTREATPAPAETPAAAPSKEDGEEKDDVDEEEGGPKILSKKEKEKLKKEKEKVYYMHFIGMTLLTHVSGKEESPGRSQEGGTGFRGTCSRGAGTCCCRTCRKGGR